METFKNISKNKKITKYVDNENEVWCYVKYKDEYKFYKVKKNDFDEDDYQFIAFLDVDNSLSIKDLHEKLIKKINDEYFIERKEHETKLRFVASSITGYERYSSFTSASDDYYETLTKAKDKKRQIKDYASGALNIYLTDKEINKIYNFIEGKFDVNKEQAYDNLF